MPVDVDIVDFAISSSTSNARTVIHAELCGRVVTITLNSMGWMALALPSEHVHVIVRDMRVRVVLVVRVRVVGGLRRRQGRNGRQQEDAEETVHIDENSLTGKLDPVVSETS